MHSFRVQFRNSAGDPFGTWEPAADEAARIAGGDNILLYGVPGSGKSWTIEHEYCHRDSVVERLVFHSDYTNADFIGQIMPVVDGDKQVTYEFTPGPFTAVIRDAYRDPAREYIFIIEEVNRGNAPAIFGEVFRLLDRTVEPKTVDGITYPAGTSEYGVTHQYMAEEINGLIVSGRGRMASAEDKRLGVYFIRESDVTFDRRAAPSDGYDSLLAEYNDLLRTEAAGDMPEDKKQRLDIIRRGLTHNRVFPEKVIKYLWDDAFKFDPGALFDTDRMESLEQVIRTFVYSRGRERFKIFKPDVFASLYPDPHV